MSEIKKMYENAGVESDINYVCDKEPCEKHSVDCQECSHLYDTREDYPDFTAEKVLKVIVFFLNKGIRLDFSIKENTKISVENFKECIAQIVAKYWQDLTEEEKQQVKGILE